MQKVQKPRKPLIFYYLIAMLVLILLNTFFFPRVMQHEKALALLQSHEAKLHELARFLNEKEAITGEEFMEILKRD